MLTSRLNIAARIAGNIAAVGGPNCCPKETAAKALSIADALIEQADGGEALALSKQADDTIRDLLGVIREQIGALRPATPDVLATLPATKAAPTTPTKARQRPGRPRRTR